MQQLNLYSIVGLVPPFSGYVCDVYGNQCEYIGTITTTPITITLPPSFDMAPAIGFKLIDSTGCEKFMVLYCGGELPRSKQYQDGDYFFFMDYNIYQFQ
jgi:hypothetical protein